MQIMTFNLRFDNDDDGDNAWKHRKNIVVETILRRSPSILGTQEGMPRQLSYLQERLSDYIMHAPVRPVDETCQYPTLFYRKDRLRAIETGEFWLSLTPDAHRSKHWDSAFPRMMSYGLFEDLSSGRRFWALVTHLDHMGGVARLEQSRIIVEWMLGRPEPKILMGDFNDFPGSPVHGLLTGSEGALLDTWQALGMDESEESMTRHDFRGVPKKYRMDWILVSRSFAVSDAQIVRDHIGGCYPSDHFPYVANLGWA